MLWVNCYLKNKKSEGITTMSSLKYFIHKSIYSIQSYLIIAKNNPTSLFQKLVQAVILPQHGAYLGVKLSSG
ncbi:hypothetical protein DW868_03055 [Streptococcus lutetiensis]|nr:hypothetical protein DW868_03055 [Streptococcus lutetiensis]